MTTPDLEELSTSDTTVTSVEVLSQLLVQRHSTRGFRPDHLDRPVIEQLLTLAGRAPSWGNVQPWMVEVVSGEQLASLVEDMHHAEDPTGPDLPFPGGYQPEHQDRRRASGWALYDAVGVLRGDREASGAQGARNFSFFGAPHVAILSTPKSLGSYGVLDCGLYVQTFLLAAAAHGLGAIAQAAPASRSALLHRRLDIGEDRAILCAISFGRTDLDHPANAFRTDRAALDEVVRFHG